MIMNNEKIIKENMDLPDDITLDDILDNNFLMFSDEFDFGVSFIGKLYYKLTKRNVYVIYYDINNVYEADKIFVDKNLDIRFTNIEFSNEKNSYCLIVAVIKQEDVEKFINCMIELKNKILLKGQHPDYPDFCKESNVDLIEMIYGKEDN